MSHTVETMQSLKSSYVFAHPVACKFATNVSLWIVANHPASQHHPKPSYLQNRVPAYPSLQVSLTKLQAVTDNWQMFGHCAKVIIAGQTITLF